MNTPNTLIQLDLQHLHAPLPTLQPMQLCAYAVKIVHVPAEARDVTLTVFQLDGTAFQPVPCTQDANGDWFCDILGALFPTAGDAVYQVAMRDGDGRRFAGGRGSVKVKAFDVTSGGEITPEGDIILTTIPDGKGRAHRIKAVNHGTDEKPDWTWEIED